mgnify:CR=1 FL=1
MLARTSTRLAATAAALVALMTTSTTATTSANAALPTRSETQLVSVSPDGLAPGDNASESPSISADGR